jgi:hypothetical protein
MASFLLLLSLFFLLLLAPFSSSSSSYCTDQRRRARMIRASGYCERALAQIWRQKGDAIVNWSKYHAEIAKANPKNTPATPFCPTKPANMVLEKNMVFFFFFFPLN